MLPNDYIVGFRSMLIHYLGDSNLLRTFIFRFELKILSLSNIEKKIH